MLTWPPNYQTSVNYQRHLNSGLSSSHSMIPLPTSHHHHHLTYLLSSIWPLTFILQQNQVSHAPPLSQPSLPKRSITSSPSLPTSSSTPLHVISITQNHCSEGCFWFPVFSAQQPLHLPGQAELSLSVLRTDSCHIHVHVINTEFQQLGPISRSIPNTCASIFRNISLKLPSPISTYEPLTNYVQWVSSCLSVRSCLHYRCSTIVTRQWIHTRYTPSPAIVQNSSPATPYEPTWDHQHLGKGFWVILDSFLGGWPSETCHFHVCWSLPDIQHT